MTCEAIDHIMKNECFAVGNHLKKRIGRTELSDWTSFKGEA